MRHAHDYSAIGCLFLMILVLLLLVEVAETAPGPKTVRHQDFYARLGVHRQADVKEIKRAYRTISKKTHPDSPTGSAELFMEVTEAYEVLTDPQKRRQYDQVCSPPVWMEKYEEINKSMHLCLQSM